MDLQPLTAIQAELKAPKNQLNKFGGYNYRSCEDILEAVKPLLKKHNCTMTITDSVECHGDRVYVCATVRFKDPSGNETEVRSYAREAASKKGMDDSQITGSASSYARKYALNGLYLIDDTKDADTRDNRQTENVGLPENVKQAISELQSIDALNAFYKANIGQYSGSKQEFISACAARKEELAATAGL